MTKRRAGRHGRAAASLALTVFACTSTAQAPLRVQQGTDIAVARGADGRLLIDLAGRLWTLPAEGGSATPLTAAGEYARRPAPSPDGTTIAFEALRDDGHQVMLMDASGGNTRVLTQGPGQNMAPAWSPDGRRLAVASSRGGDFGIWDIDAATLEAREITAEPGDEIDPAWHPDGRRLAYVHERAGRSALVVREPGGRPRIVVDGATALRAPAWRPDGTVIAYIAASPRGSRLRMVILSEPPVDKPVGGAEDAFPARPVWLDRNRLLYTADGQIRIREIGAMASADVPFEAAITTTAAPAPRPRRLPPATGERTAQGVAGTAVLPDGHLVVAALGELWEIDASGALLRQLTVDAYTDRDPDVGPDGRTLAFTSDRTGTPQVWSMDLATGSTRQLTMEALGADRPAWNASGGRIAYLAGGAAARVLHVQSGQATTLADGLIDPGAPAWWPGDERIGLTESGTGHPQLMLLTVDGQATPRRSTLPAAVLAGGSADLRWSGDGTTLLVASGSGVFVLPALGDGLVGADWRRKSAASARRARWLPGGDVLFSDAGGLARVDAAEVTTRIPLALSWRPAGGAGRSIVRASRIFDGRAEGYLTDHEVVVEGERIVAIRPWSGDEAGATLVDARGKTLVPGLIDLAVRLPARDIDRLGRTLLAFGVTTVQAMADGGDGELREIAERWQARAAGPRILRSPAWCDKQAGAAPAGDATVPVGAMRLCPAAPGRIALLAGPLQDAGATVWTASWLASSSGLVHAISPAALAGPGSRRALLGHAGGNWYEDAVVTMGRSGVVLVPALATSGLPALLRQQPDLLASRQYQALVGDAERKILASAWQDLDSDPYDGRSALRRRQRQLGRLLADGGRLAAASNAPLVPFGLGLQAEIRLLAGIGLSPAEALRTATSEAARAVGLGGEIGTLEPGAVADLLVIDGDPLANLTDLLRIEAVVTAGTLRDLPALLPTPAVTLEKFTTDGPHGLPKQPGPPR